MEATTSIHHLPLSVPILFVSLLIILISYLRSTSTKSVTANHCPCTHPVIGNLLPFLANRHRFLDWATDMLSASPTATIEVRGPFGLSRGVCTANPLVVDHLLRANFSNFIKGHRYRSLLSDLLGQGIFVADDALWTIQRKIASREFTTRSLKSFVDQVVRTEIHERLLPRLAAAADSDEAVDLQDVLRRFGFDNICSIAFGTDPAILHPDHHHQPQPEPFVAAFDDAVEISAARLFAPVPWIWRIKRFLNIGSERRLREAIQIIDDYAARIIDSREEQELKEKDKHDLLSRFIAVIEEDGGELSRNFLKDDLDKRRFLRDIVISFVLAGKDSTSSALTWFFWLISANPRCGEKILAELAETCDDDNEGGGELGYDDLKGLHYLHAALTEALRLYPPVPIDSRLVVKDDVLPDGTSVQAGWFADYSAYAMGRAEAVWGKGCEEYAPERWLVGGIGEFVAAEAWRFPVFHSGPRICLGREMAYVQMKAVAAAILRRFEVVSTAPLPPQYELSITLRMKGGFPVRLRRR